MRSKNLFGLLAVTALGILAIALLVAAPGVSADGDQADIPKKKELKYHNLGAQLDGLVVQVEKGEAASEDAASDTPVHSGESVAVTIHLSGKADEVVSFLEDNGGDPRNVGEGYIEAYVPVTLLGQLSEQPGVIRVREIVPPEPAYGPITSQGVLGHGSPAWNEAGYTGRGVKVGIIDEGFEDFASLMGTELPTTVQARCYTEVGVFTSNLADCGNNSKHGTATAENVMDIAPDVSLYIAHYRSLGDFRDTVNWMISEGVSVINRSLGGSFEGPGNGTSPFTISRLNTINLAVEGGIIFLNSAGNNAEVTWFQDSPPSIRDSDGDGDGFIEFAEGDTTNSIGRLLPETGVRDLAEGRRIWAYLRWEDTWPGASTDLDLYLVDSTSGEIVEREEDHQSGRAGDVPTESLSTEIPRDGEYHIAVVYRGGNLPGWIQLTVPKAFSLEHSTEGYSINGSSESANPGMLAVGATHYWDTHTIADYSSRGPALDGRIKPDIVGAACGQTESYGPSVRDDSRCWYSGTSSASPHVAGLAALVRQRFPDYTPQQVAQYLKDNAAQREVPDPNNTWGHGFAQLPSSQIPETQKEAERAALVTLYNAAAGQNWTNKGNWLSGQPVGHWHGVTTDPSGRAVGLSLPENGLTGEIPSELGGLANLTWLNLKENELRGELPSELGNLSSLTWLWFHDNQLTGEIPSRLGNLTKLTELYLWGNELSGEIPSELGSLTDLERLYISQNQLRGEIPPELASLTSLEILALGGNQLTGTIPTWLGSLANLEELYLWENQLAGEIPSELGNLTKLQQLYLSDNRLTGTIPTWLGSLANLERLVLWGNQLTGTIPTELDSLTKLQLLSLSDNQLTGTIPTWLGSLVNLEELYLWGNQLTGEIPAELGNLANLQVLSLSRNQLAGPIPAKLGSLVNLQELYLNKNQLTGQVPAWLGSLANLEELYLWGNELSGEIPSQLVRLPNLQSLFLSDNQLTGCVPAGLRRVADNDFVELDLPFCAPGPEEDRTALVTFYNATGGVNWTNKANWLTNAPVDQWHGVITDNNGRVTELDVSENRLSGNIPAHLGSLSNLTHLRLHRNGLTGTIPTVLGGLSNLEVLSLGGNRLTGTIPTQLSNLTNLRGLYLWGNQLTGPVPAWLGSLTNLQWLYLSDNQLSSNIPAELGSLANLEQLALWENQLTGTIPTELGSLTKLQLLSLSDNQLTGTIPTSLGSLVNLEELYLWGNQLTGEIPAELGSLTKLQQLSLSDNRLTGTIPTWLGSLTDLEVLYISRNQLAGEIPSQLGNLTKLQRLSLYDNQLTGTIPTWLGSLTDLEWLYLDRNQLSGPIPQELGSLTNLQQLRLNTNQLTGEIPAELGRLTNLTALYLAGNQLTGCVPADLRDVEDNDFGQLGLPFCHTGDPLVARYDTNGNGRIEKSEVIQAINDYLFGTGPDAPSKAEVIRLINLYLFG